MFSRRRAAWEPEQRAALAVVGVLGALVLLLPDLPSSGPSRIEATQTATPRLFAGFATTTDRPHVALDAPVTTAASAGDAAAAGEAAPDAVTESADDAEKPLATATASPSPPATSADAGPTTATSPPTTAVTTSQPAPLVRADDVVVTTATTRPPTTAAPSPTRSGFGRLPSVEAEVVPLTNGDRRAAGLSTLSRNACLDAAASGFAEQLARSGVLAHNPGAGSAVRNCRPNAAWGDNVGTSNPCSASLLEERWMASPSHRHNILTAEFRSIGVGTWTDDKGACWVQVLFSS